MYMCEKCKTKRKSAKQLSIYKYPQVLVSIPTLMVNRFSSDALFAFSVLRAAPSRFRSSTSSGSSTAARGGRSCRPTCCFLSRGWTSART